MTPEEMRLIVAAAAPGSRLTFVIVDVPASTSTLTPAVPSAYVPPPEAAGQAPAIAQRQEPFTTDELAIVLRTSRDTVSGWCRTGVLKGATKPGGGGWRIPPSAVLALLTAPGAADAGTSGGSAPTVSDQPGVGSVVQTGIEGGTEPAIPGRARTGDVARTSSANGDETDTFDVASLGDWRRRRGRGNGRAS